MCVESGFPLWVPEYGLGFRPGTISLNMHLLLFSLKGPGTRTPYSLPAHIIYTHIYIQKNIMHVVLFSLTGPGMRTPYSGLV